jgi:hypothetical protein
VVVEEIHSGYDEGRGVYSVVTTLGAGHSGEEGVSIFLSFLAVICRAVGAPASADIVT